jgi:hypothetical protein
MFDCAGIIKFKTVVDFMNCIVLKSFYFLFKLRFGYSQSLQIILSAGQNSSILIRYK